MARQPTRLIAQQRKRIRELVAKHDPRIRAAFEAAIQSAKTDLDLQSLIEAIQRNDLRRAAELLRINQAALFPLEDAIRAAMVEGGMSVVLPKAISGAFSFNGRHARAESLIAEIGADLVTKIGSPGTEAIRAILLQGQKEGVGTATVARRLAGTLNPRTGVREGGIMGLDGPRARRSARVREILSDPDQIRKYFKGIDKKTGKPIPRYTSTDRRFDAKVQKAIAEGRALPKADVERIAKLHDARLLKARGQTIARNEAFRAQAQGRNEAFLQLMDEGKVTSTKKRWQHATAKNPRHSHQKLHGKEIDINDTYEVKANGVTARARYPHDPNLGPEHTIGCRCSVIYIPQFAKPKMRVAA